MKNQYVIKYLLGYITIVLGGGIIVVSIKPELIKFGDSAHEFGPMQWWGISIGVLLLIGGLTNKVVLKNFKNLIILIGGLANKVVIPYFKNLVNIQEPHIFLSLVLLILIVLETTSPKGRMPQATLSKDQFTSELLQAIRNSISRRTVVYFASDEKVLLETLNDQGATVIPVDLTNIKDTEINLEKWLKQTCKGDQQILQEARYLLWTTHAANNYPIGLGESGRIFALFSKYELAGSASGNFLRVILRGDVVKVYCEVMDIASNHDSIIIIPGSIFEQTNLIGSVRFGNTIWLPANEKRQLLWNDTYWSFQNQDSQAYRSIFNDINNRLILVDKRAVLGDVASHFIAACPENVHKIESNSLIQMCPLNK